MRAGFYRIAFLSSAFLRFFDKGILSSHGEDFDPFALDGRDVLEFWDLDGRSIVEGFVGAEEVVMGCEEDDQRKGAVIGFKAAGRTDVELESSVETFDQLLKGSVGG